MTPWNNAMGDTMRFNSWNTERLPDYLWLAFLHDAYGKEDSIQIAYRIFKEMKKSGIQLLDPSLSKMLSLTISEQEVCFSIIAKNIDPSVISPLTVILHSEDNRIFSKYFFTDLESTDNKINALLNVLEKYYDHQSNDATDVRYMILMPMLIYNKLVVQEGLSITIEALNNYPITDHDEEIMRMYRPTIRSMEIMDFEPRNTVFVEKLRREISMITECKPMYLKFENRETNEIIETKGEEYLGDLKKAIDLHMARYKLELTTSVKYEVLIGSLTYVLKIFNEIIENQLETSIIGRHAVRTMSEVYVNMKYLTLKESEDNKIWSKYKEYGLGKYKLVALKCREFENETKHIVEPLISLLVNEPKSEEFMDMDLKFFDNARIKDKFEVVGEKQLYDLLYDYDTNFVHGFWGAVRESAMLHCDNSMHFYHAIPDIEFKQNLQSVMDDCIMILSKYVDLISASYPFHDWFVKKYGDLNEA